MDTIGQIRTYQSLYSSLNQDNVPQHIAKADDNNDPHRLFIPRKESHVPMLHSGSFESQALLSQDDGAGILVKDHHIWLIGLLSGIVIVLVLLSCSLRSNYFQESYIITRAKEWVQLPLLQQPSAQESLLSVEIGATAAARTSSNDAEPAASDAAKCTEICSWVSETDPGQKPVAMKSASADADLCNRQKLVRDMSALSLADTYPLGAVDQPIQSSSSGPCQTEREPLKAAFAKNKDHFVFGNADIFLTKSESLDEARNRSETLVREKCFKANRSVDEILTQQLGSENCQNASFGTPKCRKLQERRGSNHSLTIAVKATETTLPTVTTPRECSAAQFLLTAGNVMSRRQLRSCLKDINAIHAEFWSIPTNAPEVQEQVAARKNRYRYVLPNPHSRVKLPVSDPSDPACGYINANYIRAHNGDANAYIATQGPLSNTIDDFWSMVWSERAPAIVMITQLVESGKAKCESYLPEEVQQSCLYGDVLVTLDSIEETDACTVRHLSLKFEEEVRSVSHYWYSNWSDHKTPDNPRTLVDLAVNIESLRRGQTSLFSTPTSHETKGPIVVHCSAGVGRTGCFIALCQGLSQLVSEGTVDILGIVCALRCDRGGMVQTAEQYEFIHRGLCLFERSTLSDYIGD